MVTLNFERYRAVATPLALKLTHKIENGVIAVIWVLAYVLFGLPKSFMFELTTANGILQCDAIHTSTTIPILIKTWHLICTLFIPSTVVCWTHSRVMCTLKQDLQIIENVCASRDITRSHAKRNAKMMGLLLLMVIVFVFCYVPFNVVTLLDLSRSGISTRQLKTYPGCYKSVIAVPIPSSSVYLALIFVKL